MAPGRAASVSTLGDDRVSGHRPKILCQQGTDEPAAACREAAPRPQTATMFTSFFGTTMIFLTVLPARNGLTFSGLGRGFDFGLGGVGGDPDDVAQLAVDLHRDFERVLDQQRGVELRPGRVGQGEVA